MYVENTKKLMICAVTAQLICAFVFAFAKSRFYHDAAQIINPQISPAFGVTGGKI